MDAATQKKWDSASSVLDFMGGFGEERRWRPHKSRLFSAMEGTVLFVAVGTGLDFPSFPPGKDITGVDISPKMLERAAPRAAAYQGDVTLQQMDVREMSFPDETFDQVFTSCTFCSVPDPVRGLTELRRVLKPGGDLRMFEHTGSKLFPFKFMLDAMNPLARKVGPEINRDTVANVEAAGFKVHKVTNVFLDIVRTIEAVKPAG